MFGWLKNEIDRVRLNETNWRLVRKTSAVKMWRNDSSDTLSLNFFNIPPDISAPLSQVDDLRNSYRQKVLAGGGGLIKVDVTKLRELPAVECILKIPMQPTGMTYLGSFTIPFRDKSYVIKLQCSEQGITGMREATVFALHATSADLGDENNDPFNGWARDPYDADITQGALMNLSEDMQYDERFPDHPLSRVRNYLSEIRNTVSFDERLIKSPQFKAV